MSLSSAQEAVLSSSDADYIAHLYKTYLQNRGMVDGSWAEFFDDLGDDARVLIGEMAGAKWTPEHTDIEAVMLAEQTNDLMAGGTLENKTKLDKEAVQQAAQDSVRALMLIRSYRVRGHLAARLDPLGIHIPEDHPELDPQTYGFERADWHRPIYIGGVLGLQTANIEKILRICHETYCGTIGIEFMHIQFPEEKAWIQQRIEEARNQTDFTPRGKKAILERLIAAEGFEQFLQKKFIGTKRFGIEGAEAVIPCIEQIMKRGGQQGLEEIVVGMAHRGRLNMLTNVLNKPFVAVFSEFLGNDAGPDSFGSGDVKYHLGTSSDRDFDGNIVHLSLTPNPSHLEAVNPVVMGRVRAKQNQRGDIHREKVMGVLLHGDAAMAGQGVVAETFHLSELEGYMTGGTIHVVINNQIGFTTLPRYSRSSTYSTDVGKTVQAPIIHVNGDDPEAVVHAARMATEYRMLFHKDIVIDIVCYRRHGHNEGDEPMFTQPVMYSAIKNHSTTADIYAVKLMQENLVTADEVHGMRQEFENRMEQEFAKAKDYNAHIVSVLDGAWKGLDRPEAGKRSGQTSLTKELVETLGEKLCHIPDNFNANSKIARQWESKSAMFSGEKGFDWATAEALAFASLLNEDYDVRLSGQDSGRGTFSQRHAILYDQLSGKRYIPLNHIADNQAVFEVIDSPLSEFSVMGFEYGFSLAEPNALTIWEGQFGDFANGAQVMIDQFISCGEAKWQRMTGLVLMLPHGYEGQGPEHSSARLERFLQLCAEDNMQVVNCTTPANFFHVLRRQLHRNFRKPLIAMTPKSLLRHPRCLSDREDFIGETCFHRVLGETKGLVADKKIRRVVFCSGKVYYDLLELREQENIKDVAIVRLEQIYPFPDDTLAEILVRYSAAEAVWCQEEPQNMGAWNFIERRMNKLLEQGKTKRKPILYAGRNEAASPATGSLKKHVVQQEKLLNEALGLGQKGKRK